MGIGRAAGGSYRRQIPHEHRQNLLTLWRGEVSGSPRGSIHKMWDSYLPRMQQKASVSAKS